MTPKRIQLRSTKGWRMPEGVVYVGRPTQWGNRYVVGQRPHPDHITSPCDCAVVVSLRQAVALFRADMSLRRGSLAIERWLAPLRGRDLACWCPLDQPCHADILLEIANR